MALEPISGNSKVTIYNSDVEIVDKTARPTHQSVTVDQILAMGGGSGVPTQTDVVAVSDDINTTAELDYKVNKITATATDYAVKLPEPQLGGVVGVVNNSTVDVHVFPYDADDSIVGLEAGEAYVVPADGKLYNITCVQNPSVGVWSVTSPTANNTVTRTVSTNLTADGSVVYGDYTYSSELLNAQKTTYYPAGQPYDVLNAPAADVNYFDSPEFNVYNKVRLKKIIVKSNVPAGDLSMGPSQLSTTLMGVTALQLYQLYGYIRIASLGSNGVTYTVNEFNLHRFMDTYSASVYNGYSTNSISHYMGNDGALYQMIEASPSNSVWQDINDANGNRRIYYGPYIGYGQTGTPYSGYPAGFSFEAEIIAEFEFSM